MFPGKDGDILGTLGMVAPHWSYSCRSCGERLLLRCDGNAGNSFPTTQEKDPSSRASRRNRGSSGCGPDFVLPLEWRRVCRGTSGVSPGESVLVSSGGMHVYFPPDLKQQCHASLRVDQGICGFPSRLSHEAFPRVFPTCLSHVPPWCASILGLKVEAMQGKQVSWNGLRHLGDSGNGGTTL